MNRNLRSPVALALLAVILYAAACGLFAAEAAASGPHAAPPEAREGVLDLSGWSWEQDGIVPLSGDWKFEWGGGADRIAGTTLRVPGTWGSTATGDARKLSDRGYGVYRLTIVHPPEQGNLAIRLPNISTAYELSIDGEVVLTRGVPAKTADAFVPVQLPAIVYFDAIGTTTELQLEVANFAHRRGGIRTELVMGDANHIQRLQLRISAQELLLIGCLVMIGFYHMGLFVMRRREIANLMFSLLCLLVALRTSVIGEGYLVQWLPWVDWGAALRIEYVCFVAAGWAGFKYYRAVYPKEIGKLVSTIATCIAAALAASVLLFSPLTFSTWLLVYQVFILLLSLRILVGLIQAAVRRREGAILALVGVAGLVITIVNDMLSYNGWWQSADLVPFGLVFLIAMNSFVISLRFSRTYDRAERMSAELVSLNSTLEERIGERTEELYRSNRTLEAAMTELEAMEQSRRQLVSNISHDLRTPITLLQGYLEALRDNVIVDPGERDATVKLMLTKVEGLDSLIQDLFELSLLEARKVQLSTEEIPLAAWKERIREQYELELQRQGIGFHCRLADETTGEKLASIDVRRMDRVFANLLYNAIRYTSRGGDISVELASDADDGHSVRITVADSGEGIAQDDLPYVFDRFYRKDKSRRSSSEGSGLGLAITKEIVELHGGRIRAYNRPEGGSAFEMLLPLSG